MKSADLRLLLARGSSRTLFVVVALASLISATITIANGYLLASIIVGVIYQHPNNLRLIYLLATLWLFKATFQSSFEYWCSLQASKIKREIRKTVTAHLDSLEMISPSHLTNLLIKGLNSLDIYLGRFIPQLFGASVTPLAVIVTIYLLDPLSAIIAVLTLPLIPLFGALIGKYTSHSVTKKWKSLGTLSKYFEDSLRGFVTLKIFGRHRSQSQRIEEMGDRYTSETMKVLKISFLSALALELVATISVALIAVSIGFRLVDAEISFIHGLAVLILAPEVYFPLRNAASLFHASADGSEVLGQIRNLLETQKPSVESSQIDFSSAHSLAWKEWTLQIPGVVESRIQGATISVGEVLFIVGESGIGKTSFAENLLGRIFDTEVAIDGHILEDSDTVQWQKSIGWVPQLPQMAPGTLREQFQLVKSNITDNEIVELLEQVQLDIRDLSRGLDTTLGGSGEKSDAFSGGQLRKVAVARALARSPRFIIVDEPSADLDSISAQAIMKALYCAVDSSAALICITHDSTLMRSGDRVIEVSRSQT